MSRVTNRQKHLKRLYHEKQDKRERRSRKGGKDFCPKHKPRRKPRRRSRTTITLVNSERKTERG